MATIEKHIDVNVPVREAYNQWTQFESFPQFMEGVESVRQHGDTSLHWIANIGGTRQEWDAEITQQEPDQRIAWTSTSGVRNGGSVDFHPLDDVTTRITLTMDFEPRGAVEAVGTAVGIPAGQVDGDLKRFKEFIESRGSATGAWRGEIPQDAGTNLGDSARELTGAGTPMGSVSSTRELGSDYGSPTGQTGFGEMGTGLNDPQDLGTGLREDESER
jgi:carbon monoxide dehydrogenase subunit G